VFSEFLDFFSKQLDTSKMTQAEELAYKNNFLSQGDIF